MNYYNNTRISQSKLKLFIESREKYFYRYVQNNEEESDPSFLSFGRFYHAMVLQPEILKTKYSIAANYKVDGLMGTFIEEYFKAHNIAGLKLEKAKEIAYNKAGFKWTIDKVWEKFTTEYPNMIYYKFLKESKDKETIKKEDNDKAVKMFDKLQENTEVINILNPEDPLGGTVEIFNELEIDWSVTYCSLPLKSMLDRVIVNHNTKTITIADLKTTKCSNLKAFRNDMKGYKYYIQAIFYINAVEYLVENDEKWKKYKDYKLDFVFIPQYTEAPYHTLRPVRLSQSNLEKGYSEYREALIEMEACMLTGVWKSDDIYSDMKGIVTLDLFKYD
jgi:hypothetical protein